MALHFVCWFAALLCDWYAQACRAWSPRRVLHSSVRFACAMALHFVCSFAALLCDLYAQTYRA